MQAASNTPGPQAPRPGEYDSFPAYLQQLTGSPEFASRRRRCQLLEHLVARKLAGEEEQISEYGIALDVFQKPASFDPRLDATVRVEISRLRRALAEHYSGPGKADPWRIEFPSRGYVPSITPTPGQPAPQDLPAERPRFTKRRFTKLQWIAAGVALILTASLAAWRLGRQGAIQSIVVLPFANLTGDANNEYLADGVTEQLTDSLAKIPALRVVARTSSFQFKGKGVDIREVGRRVNADAVVEGSLRLIDSHLRITVQVNRSADGYHILSQTFDGGLQDLGRLETALVLPVLAAIRPGLTLPKRASPDPEAYNLYLKARARRGLGTLAAFQEAVGFLDQAIQRDPEFADAYAGLATAYASASSNFASDPEHYAKRATAASAKALELDPFSAPAYAAQGYVDAMIFMHWSAGEQKLRSAIRLMPGSPLAHNWLGITLLARGRFEEALKELRTVEDLDPLVPDVTLGLGYFLARRYDDALRQYAKVLRLHPDLVAIHPFIGEAWEAKRDYAKAMAEFQAAGPEVPSVKADMTLLLAVMGKEADARRMLGELENPGPAAAPPNALAIAAIYGALGDRDRAFEWLERAYRAHVIWPIKVHPFLDPLRKDPRFAVLVAKAGL